MGLIDETSQKCKNISDATHESDANRQLISENEETIRLELDHAPSFMDDSRGITVFDQYTKYGDEFPNIFYETFNRLNRVAIPSNHYEEIAHEFYGSRVKK